MSSISLPANGNVVVLAIDLSLGRTGSQPDFATSRFIGDGRINAQVTGVQNIYPWSTAGGAFRTSVATAPFADVLVTPGNGVIFPRSRAPADGTVSGQTGPSQAAADRAGLTGAAGTPRRHAEAHDEVLSELNAALAPEAWEWNH